MNTFIEFICDYWYILVAAVAVTTVSSILIYNFVKLPPDTRTSKVQEWLLYAVVAAERELGSGTGQIKLRMVYDMFMGKFPIRAKILTFDRFSKFVDDALERMNKMLTENKNLAEYVNDVQ